MQAPGNNGQDSREPKGYFMVADSLNRETCKEKSVLELVQAVQAGDRASMEALAEAVQGPVRAFIYCRTWETGTVDDLVQETLLAMVAALGRLRRAEAFWLWLYRIARSKMVQQWRREQRGVAVAFSSLEGQDGYEPESRQDQSGLEAVLFAERRAQLAAALARLEQYQAELIHLRCLEGLAYSQIGSHMACSVGQARTRLHRARRSLAADYARAAG